MEQLIVNGIPALIYKNFGPDQTHPLCPEGVITITEFFILKKAFQPYLES
jgi:hypothetical protein